MFEASEGASASDANMGSWLVSFDDEGFGGYLLGRLGHIWDGGMKGEDGGVFKSWWCRQLVKMTFVIHGGQLLRLR